MNDKLKKEADYLVELSLTQARSYFDGDDNIIALDNALDNAQANLFGDESEVGDEQTILIVIRKD